RLRVLIGDEVEQRAGAHEDDASSDGAALVFQGDLRPAERVDSGKGPAREGDDAVARAGRQDEVAVSDLIGLAVRQEVQHARPHIPDEGVRPVVDAALYAVELVMQPARLRRLETIERAARTSEARGWPAIDLAAASRGLVDDDGTKSGRRQRRRGADAGGPGADDDGRRPIAHSRSFA